MLKLKVQVDSSDLLIMLSPVDKEEILYKICEHYIAEVRSVIMNHSKIRPEFLTSLEPLTYERTYTWLDTMYEAALKSKVGPMASVAGITSELLGKHLLSLYPEMDVYIENGGDLFIHSHDEVKIGIYAGESDLSNKLAIQLKAADLPMGVCTSAGTIGHSLSFGKADAVVVLSKDTALADAVATSTGNKVQTSNDIDEALRYAMSIEGIVGVVIIIENCFGALGQITLTEY